MRMDIYDQILEIPLPADTPISFLPMGSVSTDGRVELDKTIEQGNAGNYTVFKNGDIIFAKITPCMENGKMAIVDGLLNGYGAGSTEFIVLRPNKDIVTAEWLYLFLSQTPFRLQCQQHMTGSAGQKRLPPKYLASCTIPVPSLPGQKRIVAKIEELFSELDNGVETLEKTKQQLAAYRQAVLKSILDVHCRDAKVLKIGDACFDVKVGIVIKPTQYYVNSGGVRAFRNANVRRNYIQDDNWALISQEGHRQNSRSIVHTGNVLIARSGVNLGMAAAIPEQFDGYNAIDVVIAVPKQDMVLSKYLAYYTNSPYGISSVKNNQRGVAQGHLNITVYAKLPLMLPPIKVQEKVIDEIESRLSVCDSIEKTVEAALQQAEALRQGILKKAFEGRLCL